MTAGFDAGAVGSAALAAFLIIALAIGLTVWRLARGPSFADRVAALDLLTTLAVASLGIVAIGTGQAVFIDVALALALVGFLATVAFAVYIERRQPARMGEE